MITFADSFAPPLRRHHAAIDSAAHATTEAAGEAAGDHGAAVRVVVGPAPDTCPLPMRVRTRLLRTIHPHVEVVPHGADTAVRPGEHRNAFGDDVAALERRVRRDPVAHWSELHERTQAELTVRVCCIGAESTGKTTLVDALAARHATHRIGEFGRDYTLQKKADGTNDHWDTDDFVRIAIEQQRLEDDAAIGAGPLLFCDTDAMTTALWHERYQGHRSREVEELGRKRTYDLFVLCNTDIPWEHDEIRLGADTRASMHQRFLEVLTTERSEPWVLVSGSVEQRMATVEAKIDELGLLTPQSMFAAARFASRE